MTTFKAWMKKTFTRKQLHEIDDDGVRDGYPNLTHYSEILPLYEKYNQDIWDAIYEDALESEYENPIHFISGLPGAEHMVGDVSFKNHLVWWMAERTAREIIEKRK